MKRNPHAPFWLAMEQREREIVEGALRATGGSVARASSALGIDRTYLYQIIKRLGIDRKVFSKKAST